MTKKKSDFDVGYGRPPKQSQFKPGQSGNPRGRPKGRVGLAQLFQALVNKKVTVTEHGRRRKLTKAELALTQIINKAAAGQDRSLALFIELMRTQEPANAMAPFSSSQDDAVMQSLTRKFRQLLDEEESDQ